MEDAVAGISGRAALDNARRNIERQNWDEAIEACRQAMTDPASVTEATTLMGVVAYFLDDISQAITLFSRVADRPGVSSDVPEVLAVLFAMTGMLQDALFHGKLATARPLDDRILPLFGGRLPPFATVFLQMQERPLAQRGRWLLERGDCAGAITLFQQHLALAPRDIDALDGLAEAYLQSGQARLAIDLLRLLRILAPADARYVSRLGRALSAVGELAEGQACHDLAVLLDPSIAHLAARRRDLESVHDAALAAAATRQLDEALGSAARPPACPRDGRPLRVGILCATILGDEARGLASVLRLIDKRRVTVFAYGHGALSMGRNAPYQGSVGHWRDVRGLDAHTVAAIIRGDGLDVLVDGCGFSAVDQLVSLALRPAPTQVAWLHGREAASPATADYALGGADAAGVPGWPLGCADWPLFGAADRASRRSEAAYCYGSDATLGQINATVALAWSRILMAVPHARLCLYDNDLRDPDNARRLIGLFGNFGVAHRIEVISDATTQDFLGGIDALLVPFPSAKPLTVAHALAMAMPVVALDLPRPAASTVVALLRDSGQAEGLAADVAEYVGKAAALAAESGRQTGGGAVFQPAALAGALTEAFEQMHDRAVG